VKFPLMSVINLREVQQNIEFIKISLKNRGIVATIKFFEVYLQRSPFYIFYFNEILH